MRIIIKHLRRAAAFLLGMPASKAGFFMSKNSQFKINEDATT